MADEIDDFREHMQRYRAVTVQFLDVLSDVQLAWRPRSDAFTAGQHLLHIAQTEEFYMHGLFTGNWEPNRIRLPVAPLSGTTLKARFESVRAITIEYLSTLTPTRLDTVVPPIGGSAVKWSLRSWLWYVLEHEIHHKAQLAEYVRQLGGLPPFFAMPLAVGDRPDIRMRAQLDDESSGGMA